jgi:hypothetical protein
MHTPQIGRRDFLLLRPLTANADRSSVELSCERLYMRYLDSIDECTTTDLLDSLTRDLSGARTVRLTATAWLTREDFRSWLEPLLDTLAARGVQIEHR